MPDFLLELRSEEIPARMQAGARASLEKLFREQLSAAGVKLGDVTVWSTPRRLALIARDLPDATAAVSEEVKGPKVGAPPQALEGFLRKTGLTQDQLTERDGVYFAVSEKPGRATSEVLAEAIPAIIRAFPWPKSQRWGAASISTESLRWVRPLSGIVAIFGQELVECEVGGVRSGFATMGHRFHHPGEITIGSAADYRDKLRACHVIVDHVEREALIREKAAAAASAAGLVLVEDEGLVVENAGLTEWPVPLLGRFDEDFLEVPPEVIQLTARTNQKYFVCEKDGKLANAFVCTANIEASDGGEGVVAGNRKVLAARLSDARFFWEQDRKKTLADLVSKLESIVFHARLGSVADKGARIAGISTYLAEQLGLDPQLAFRAAHLSKADLVTGMVLEFPELQGVMGRYYALEAEHPDIANAIRDHYQPSFQGDTVPSGLGAVVGLADRLDTLVGFFMIDETPTGSRDPYALRRAALGAVAIITTNNIRLNFMEFAIIQVAMLHVNSAFRRLADRHPQIEEIWQIFKEPSREKVDYDKFINEFDCTLSTAGYPGAFGVDEELRGAIDELRELATNLPNAIVSLARFIVDRLKVQQLEAGVRHDLIDAVFALGGEDDLVRLLARVHALQAFVATPDGANLLAGYKRAANILKKEGYPATTDRHPGLDPGSRLPSGAAGGQSGTPDQVRGDDSVSKGEVRIPQDAEEDPFAMVDDPDIAYAMRERLAAQRALAYAPEPAEAALIDALAAAGPQAAAAVEAEDFAGAMAALALLRAPIDAFFDSVTVNDADAQKRAARLSLLSRFRDAVHSVADFSKIEG